MFAEKPQKLPIFKRASTPAITYSNQEKNPEQNQKKPSKLNFPTLSLNKPEKPQITETKRTTNPDTNRFGDNIVLNLPTKQSMRRNSSNVSSDIGNDLSIREFQNKDHMNERFPSDFIYMELDLLETRKSDPNDGQERVNYVGQRILPLSLSSPLQNQQSINFSNSLCRDLMLTQSNGDPTTPMAEVKKALYKHYYCDKVAQMSPSYRSYVFADRSDHLSDIPDVKEWNVYDQSDSSLINFVTYMDNTERENIPSTPREHEKPIQICESIEPKQSYFSNNPKQSELSYFLSNESEGLLSPQNIRITNINSETKLDNYSNANLFGNTTTISKKTSEKSERTSLSRTPGRVSDFMISPGDRNRIYLHKKLEEVRENTKENETQEVKKPKIKAKFKINPQQLARIMGKDLSNSNKSITVFYQTEDPASRDKFDFDEFKDFNKEAKESFESKNSLPTNHSAEFKAKPVKPLGTNNSDNKKNESHFTDSHQNTFINPSLNQSLAEKYRISSMGTESNESRFRDYNQSLEEILSRLKTCLVEYQHEIEMQRIKLDNPDLLLEYVEVAILKGEEILSNNKFMAKLDIDASGIKLAIDYFETLDRRNELNSFVLHCLYDLYETSFRKSKSLENFKSNTLKSSTTSKKARFHVPRLNLELLSAANIHPQKKLTIYNELNKTPQMYSDSKSKSSRVGTSIFANKHMSDWVAKKMTMTDYERIKIKFTSFVLICKDELPVGHPGKKCLVSALFDEMLVKGIPEDDWFDFIQAKLGPDNSESTIRSSSPLCGGSQSNQECFF